MISVKHRFRGHTSLKFVYSKGKTYRTQDLAVKVALNSQRSEYRLAVVVSKKVSKLAVTRNRIRRRIYEQIRLMETDISQPYDIIITVFDESVANMPSNELKSALVKLFSLAQIISGHTR